MSDANRTHSELWTVQDVAEFLNMSVSWVYKRTAADAIPFVRVGGRVRFIPDVIRAMVKGESVEDDAKTDEQVASAWASLPAMDAEHAIATLMDSKAKWARLTDHYSESGLPALARRQRDAAVACQIAIDLLTALRDDKSPT